MKKYGLLCIILTASLHGLEEKPELFIALRTFSNLQRSASIFMNPISSDTHVKTIFEELLKDIEAQQLCKKKVLENLKHQVHIKLIFYKELLHKRGTLNAKDWCKKIGWVGAQIFGSLGLIYLAYKLTKDSWQKLTLNKKRLSELGAMNINISSHFATAWGPSLAKDEIKYALRNALAHNDLATEGTVFAIPATILLFIISLRSLPELFDELYAQEYYNKYSFFKEYIEKIEITHKQNIGPILTVGACYDVVA